MPRIVVPLVSLALVVALAGCHHPRKQADDDLSSQDDAAPPATETHARAGDARGAAGSPTPTPQHLSLVGDLEGASPDTNTVTQEEDPAVAAGNASAQAALDKAKPVTIDAARGGLYRSDDGALEVDIPPGALAQNATVRFALDNATSIPTSAAGTPGLLVAADWGAAKVRPDASITFRGRVDERFLKGLQAIAPHGDVSALGLARDASGRWVLPVVARPDPAGRLEAVEANALGRGSLVEVTRLPAEPVSPPDAVANKLDPDPLPTVPANTPTLAPLATSDGLVDRYPPLPADLAPTEPYHPVDTLNYQDGSVAFNVRRTVGETLVARTPALVCMVSDCGPGVTKSVVDAVRFNTAVTAKRLPPAPLQARVHDALKPCGDK